MRTLSANLLSAQRASSGVPDITLTVGGVDYASRNKGGRHIEQPYGGMATILLDNSDKGITDDLRGNQVVIGYGFNGEDDSKAAPLWVLTQTDISREGDLLTQLQCIDIWQKLNLLRVLGGGGVELKGTLTGTFQPGMKVTGQTSGAVATVLGAGDGYIWVARVAKGPFSVAEIVQADLYSDSKITVSSVTDIAGGGAVAWDGDKTILQIIQGLTSGVVTVELDSSDGIVDVTKPTYATQANARVLDIIRDLMDYTKCGIVAKNDGKLHIFDITSVPGTPDYSYNTVHSFFTDLRDVSLILPNKIIVVNAEQVGTGVTPYYGEAEDAAAIARFMEIPQISFADVQSDAAAAALAASKLNRIQKEAVRGSVEVPMNCGQELFDYIRVDDTDRAGIDYYGWIGSLERTWGEGEYRLTIGLGGLAGAVGLPAGAEYPLPNLPKAVVPPVGQFASLPWVIPAAIQGYHHDLHFVADDYNTVSWGAGTVKFYDGTTQSINAGSYDLPSGLVHHLYFDLDDASPNTLKATSNYLSVMSLKTGVLCLIQRGSGVDVRATVIPSFGKEPLITADVIYLTGLLDKLPDGTYGKVLSTMITAGKIKLDETVPGNYGLVRSAEISAGFIKLTTDQDLEEQGIEIVSSTSSTRIKINEYRIAGYKAGVKQFELRASDGRAYCGGGKVILDDDGIVIKGERIEFDTSTGLYRGTIKGVSGGLDVRATGDLSLYGTVVRIESANLYPTSNYGTNLGSNVSRFDKGYIYQVLSYRNYPFASDTGYCGYSSQYWYAGYFNHLRYKTINTFQEHDDIKLIKSMKPDKRNPKIVDKATVPEEILDTDTVPPEGAEPTKPSFIDAGKAMGLSFGAIRQLADRVEALERRIK